MLDFKENYLLQQQAGYEKKWTVAELFSCHRPLSGEPLADRMNAMFTALDMAEVLYDELPATAKLRVQFWNQLRPSRIPERKYNYSVNGRKTCEWELTVNSKGLFFKDLTPMYGQQAGAVHDQLFSDFWFYGPEMPLPDLGLREAVLDQIRQAFLQDGPVSTTHFPLFQYPSLSENLNWVDGDELAKDYITLLPFGVEDARWNWHDGLVYTSFISFERILADKVDLERWISPTILTEILDHIWVKGSGVVPSQPHEKNPISRRIFMDKHGMQHLIQQDHADTYQPGPGDEERWRAELMANCVERLKIEDKQEVIHQLASTLLHHGATKVEELLVEAAKTSNLKARQAIGVVLTELFSSDSGPAVTISLLEFEHESDYWRNYVFNTLGHLRQNKAVQRFVIQCLKGENEIHFKKAVGVIQLWGMNGDQALMNRDLWLSLNWQDACAADPNFNRSLEKAIKIIQA